MAVGRISALFILASIVCLVQIIECRAHLRHHRGPSHCSRCEPGWGVVERCSRGRDTVCAECQPGTYSPHHGTQPCWICSRCGPGLYEARRCSASTDTVCDSCHRRAPENPDYQRKCGQDQPSVFLAPEDAESTGEQSELVNEDPLTDSEERERVLWQDARAEIADAESQNDVRLQD